MLSNGPYRPETQSRNCYIEAHELIQIHANSFDAPHLQAIHEITQAGPLQRICLLFEEQFHQGNKLTTIIHLKHRRFFSQKLK